jgi:hypothetical protein
MRRRRTFAVIVVVAVAAVVAGLTAAYLIGFTVVGDPFSGAWNTDPEKTWGPAGTWRTDMANPSSGLIIKRTSSGYVCTSVVGTHNSGWDPATRHGRTLEAQVKTIDENGTVVVGGRQTFEYQPWSGHLVFTDYQGDRRTAHLVLKKVADSTSIPPQKE